jgi:deazaflavin-dependent oxidoreductase (nitroreductase family)
MALAHRRRDAHLPVAGQYSPWFYRLGLGWLLGQRVAQITHRGRKSGQIRRAILEVLRYDPQTREVLVVSGWEGKSDWYRNIEREPALEVRIGRVHYRPAQEFLTLEETAELILTLFRQHPRQVRFVGRFLGIDPDAEDAVLRARLEAFFRGVRFRPAHEEECDRRAPGLQSNHSSPRNHRCWKGQHRASPHGRRATRFPAGG